MFVGRETELTGLNRLYEKKGFQMPVIYGRRRIGKSRLMQEFCKDRKTVFYVAIEQNDREALRLFSDVVLQELQGNESPFLSGFESWDMAFRYVADFAKSEKLILVIDEFPYLAGGNASIPSILQKAIDRYFIDTQLFLMLCGSSMSFMETQILDYKSPLYGRRTAQFKIEPMDYLDSARFLSGWSPEEQLMGFGLAGGVPQYLLAIGANADFREALVNEFLTSSGTLFEEPTSLMKQEMREPAVYNSIIKAISEGASRQVDISNRAGMQSKSVAVYLKALVDLGVIEKQFPYGERNSKKVIYKVKDQLFRFWYRFIPKSLSFIEMGMAENACEKIIGPMFNEYFGPVFEDICLQYLIRMNRGKKLNAVYSSFGRWWGTDHNTRQQEEIDIVGSDDTMALFAECKWKSEKVRTADYEKLQMRSMLIEKDKKREYCLFGKSGFTEGLKRKASESDNIRLVKMQDLFRI